MTSVDYFVPEVEANASPQVIAAYLDADTDTGDLIVDPFCIAPTIVERAVQGNRRVVAVTFDLLDALRVRLALTALPRRELDAAVTRLLDSPKMGLTLREHLQRLYRTACRQCGKTVTADYFIWERGRDLPQRVKYQCPSCGQSEVCECDEDDARVLQEVEPRGLHYWYVLDRVAKREDQGRGFAASLLELYTPRNLYALYNLILKAEGLFAGTAGHDFLRLALLRCLELGSKLNAVPGEPTSSHPLGLHPPSHFVEWCVWRLFEDATRQLSQRQPASPVALADSVMAVVAPAPVASAGEVAPARAFVGHISVRQLTSNLPSGSVKLILSRPPQLGRTFWALPYLWTGWLYGHAQSALLWPLVRRRSSDWPWYVRAMRSTLSALQKTLHPDSQLVLMGQSKGLAFYEALSLAAAGANLRLSSALYHPSDLEVATKPFAGLRGDYRLTWVPGPAPPPWPLGKDELAAKLRQVAVRAAEEALQQRGEPASFVRLHVHIWQALARQGVLQRTMYIKDIPAPLDFVREHIRAALEKEVGATFVHLCEGDEDGDCLWWLVHPPDAPALTERVERTTYEILASAEALQTTAFLQTVYQRFPGVLTPDREWVLACLKSYGQQTSPGWWTLQEENRGERAVRIRETLLRDLLAMGRRLGYQVQPAKAGLDLYWSAPDKQPFGFVVVDSTRLSQQLCAPAGGELVPTHKIAIISAARQDLLRLRMARSVWLRKQLTALGWRFVRDADLQEWASQPQSELTDLESLVALDPLAVQDRTQLSLI